MKVAGAEIWVQIWWSRLDRSDVADASGRFRAAPNPPHIWAGFGGSRTARTFEEPLGAAIGWHISAQTACGLSARTFGEGLATMVGDALM